MEKGLDFEFSSCHPPITGAWALAQAPVALVHVVCRGPRGAFPKPAFSSTLVPMQLIMMGTGPFAVPLFRALYETRHRVTALVTAPLRSHRGQPVAPISSIRDVAQEHGTPIVEPEDVNTPEAQSRLAEYHADLLVVCDYGQILSPPTLATTRRGGVNLHASLLPKYRGTAPINWAIYNGESETGVTVLEITPRIDAGGCLAQNPSGHRPRGNGRRTRSSPGPDRRSAHV